MKLASEVSPLGMAAAVPFSQTTDASPLNTAVCAHMAFLENFMEMKIENISLAELIPYENNPRNNDNAVEAVANSIREFGFKVPIVIDKDNVIVTGHTRLKAAKSLGLSSAPCIRADDLSDEQIKAFRIADNSVADIAQWDLNKLSIELSTLDIDMEQFGINSDMTVPELEDEDLDDEDGYYGDERERTNRAYNLDEAKKLIFSDDFWQMPVIQNNNFIQKELIGFNYAKTSTNTDAGIHFFIDDYQFERVWAYPEKYTDILMPYDCILSPDFSLYMDMPMPMKVWNIYRSRFIGAYYQSKGINVIPTISWAEKETFKFAFSGIPKGSIVAVSTIGVKEDKDALNVWNEGMNAMIETIEPSTILVYGGELDFDYKGIDVVYFQNEVLKNWKNKKEML